MRYLIAEFVRRTHHLRAAQFMEQHEATLARFAFDDPILRRTVADVCLSHGLRRHDLEDSERYPDSRDVREGRVNVRFMAILLRMGDLLDMRNDRACPLLLNAASPLPPESLAHWSQYQRITHRLTSPSIIEITAECVTQEEHRYLQDWCQWLVEEVREARVLMTGLRRHGTWAPPVAKFKNEGGTIDIRPARDAKYLFQEWKFELDKDLIFERLIRDVYDTPQAFIRELIQNGLDANRCQMCADLSRDKIDAPEYPTQASPDRRRLYPLRVSLDLVTVTNDLSGEDEKRQVLAVEDCGIGMDEEVISKYFLQAGRSYYQSEEFRRAFSFHPTSRLGVGFLSVFAVSNHVVVETNKPSSACATGPIRLTLTGPTNYLLTEKGTRSGSGTRIEVRLTDPMDAGKLTELVGAWCKRVEFPIVVNDLGSEKVIEAEEPEDLTYEMPVVGQPNARFVMKSFPVSKRDFEGELYVLAYIDERGEWWDRAGWAASTYPSTHPQAFPPRQFPSLLALHGVTVVESENCFSGRHEQNMTGVARVDYRGKRNIAQLQRTGFSQGQPSHAFTTDTINSRWEELLSAHLRDLRIDDEREVWEYKQELADRYQLRGFWNKVSKTVRIFKKGALGYVSLEDVPAYDTLAMVVSRKEGEPSAEDLAAATEYPTILAADVGSMSFLIRNGLFSQRHPVGVRVLNENRISIDWVHSSESDLTNVSPSDNIWLTAMPFDQCVAFTSFGPHEYSYSRSENNILVNENHPLVQWVLRVKAVSKESDTAEKRLNYDQLDALFWDALRYPALYFRDLEVYIAGWNKIAGVPEDLRVPDIKVSPKMLGIPWPKSAKKS